jgi:hypothetical protein
MSKVIPCRFQKYCRDIKLCPYLHIPCRYGDNCKPPNGKKCRYFHEYDYDDFEEYIEENKHNDVMKEILDILNTPHKEILEKFNINFEEELKDIKKP